MKKASRFDFAFFIVTIVCIVVVIGYDYSDAGRGNRTEPSYEGNFTNISATGDVKVRGGVLWLKTSSVTAPPINFGNASTGLYSPSKNDISVTSSGVEAVRIEDPADLSTTETSLWLYDDDNGAVRQVFVGVTNSGGTGFKYLRIAN